MRSPEEVLSALVRVNSVNPAYGDGGSEANLLPLLHAFFAERGIETFEQEVFPGRNNLIARLPGRTNRRLIFEAHMDTVSIKGMRIPPFEPRVEGGRLYGRGSVDDKAGLTAMMLALAQLAAAPQPPPCEVWLAAVVDEEFSFRGVVRLCEGLEAEAAIVAEPTQLRAVLASKGVLRVRVHTRGRAAHSSKPHLGTNAIVHMAHLVRALEDEQARLAMRSHPLLGQPTLNVGLIQGGVQVNFVPDRCAIEIDRRLLPGETAAGAVREIEAVLERVAHSLPGFDAFVEKPSLLEDEALDTPGDAPVVAHAQKVLESLNLDPTPCGVPFGSDASKLSRAGIPTLLFGPGSIDQAHAEDEFVELAQVEKAVEFYTRFAASFVPAHSPISGS